MNVDSIAEVKVLTQGYQAEFGRSSGLQISAVTKSGTNQFRGSLYDIERNSDWNSNTWANIKNGDPKPVSKQRDWGYSLGGPIGKPGGANRLFFFCSHDTGRVKPAATSIASAQAVIGGTDRDVGAERPIAGRADARAAGRHAADGEQYQQAAQGRACDEKRWQGENGPHDALFHLMMEPGRSVAP